MLPAQHGEWVPDLIMGPHPSAWGTGPYPGVKGAQGPVHGEQIFAGALYSWVL